MANYYQHKNLERKTTTLSVTSGKGGVGKTTMSVNLAFQFSEMGKKVLLLDGDLGLANIDIFLGLKPKRTLEDFFSGREKKISNILVKVNKNIDVIPSASGLQIFNELDIYRRKMLMDEISSLEKVYDYFIIDTAAGIDSNVQYLNSSVQMPVLVMTPEPASLADSYALIKLLNTNFHVKNFSVISNKVLSDREGLDIYSRLNKVCNQFLNIQLSYFGSVPLDPRMRQINRSKLVCKARPSAASSIALARISEKINSGTEVDEVKGNLQFFWNQFLQVA